VRAWSPELRDEGAVSRAAARVLASVGAALVLAGFFLDWFSGTAEFAARDFSGADLARLVRNFEIVATSSSEAGQLRATAVVLYLGPALAVNGAALCWLPVARRASGIAALAGGLYAALVLAAAFVLSVAAWTDLEGVLGSTMVGLWVTAIGAGLLGQAGLMMLRAGVSTGQGSPDVEG
jgi:hypothetical protein